MKKHSVICSMCNKESDMKYNGEHYLCPVGWYEFYDDYNSKHTNIHICDVCFVSLKQKETDDSFLDEL